MKNKISKIVFIFFVLVLIPVLFVQAVPEQQAPAGSIIYKCVGGEPGECTFADLIEAVKKLVNWGTLFALQFSVVVLAYAGFRYMISGDNQSERTKASNMLFSVVKGIALIICAWVIVRLIITGLNVNPSINTFLG